MAQIKMEQDDIRLTKLDLFFLPLFPEKIIRTKTKNKQKNKCFFKKSWRKIIKIII